jgi:hypothetical protein
VNTRSAPYRVFTIHRPDQFANFMGNARPPPFAVPNLPDPEQLRTLLDQGNAEDGTLVVPGNHRRCFDDEDLPDRDSLQMADIMTHSSRSAAVSFGRFTDRCRIPSWWRRARISTCRAVRLRNDARRVPNSAQTVGTHANRKKNGQSSIYQSFRGLRELQSSVCGSVPRKRSTERRPRSVRKCTKENVVAIVEDLSARPPLLNPAHKNVAFLGRSTGELVIDIDVSH